MKNYNIGILIGSLRTESLCRKLARAITCYLSGNMTAQIIEIGELPLYNPDLEQGTAPPRAYTSFRENVRSMDGYLFITPEYNRTIPAALKNALDVASRPMGQNCWGGKPGGIISLSVGKLGGFGANHHLRQPMVYLDILLMQQPEAYIGSAGELFNGEGEVVNNETETFLRTYAAAFEHWVSKTARD